MKTLNLNTKLLDTRLNPIMQDDGKTQADIRFVAMSALVTPTQATGEEKFRRAFLATRLRDAGPSIGLTDEDLAEIRQVVGAFFPQPEIVLAAWQAIDSAATVPDVTQDLTTHNTKSRSVQRRLALQKGSK